ncbi:LysR family transcriptional regulator [Anaeromyxobacter oryzisoli]|jgi:DNA-binding transcriptional LysR family regulator|uniref:LysR family transcriptional regulator n=1 Tax=Anaeromyxobacter oryzisoli TaxID=2925408 RepID=UPI001F561410|nr:LysR family transcriptional regulator [Anaeromyxobacter sp. SG63]
MDLNLLTTFEAVARTSSFSAAAKELRLPKSSVSRGIARLEADLGVQLVFRTTRRVSLSAAGTALYDRLSPLLRSVKAALGEMPEREELPSGELRVTAPVDLGVLFLAEAVARYTARYPSVSVDLHLTGRVVDLVGEGFDVAIRAAAKLEDSTLLVRRVAPIVNQVYASPLYLARRGTPRSEADLAGHEWVVFRPGPQRLRVTAPHAGEGVVPRGRIVCDDVLFARDAVRAGAGLGLLPGFMVEADVVAGRLVRVVPRYESRSGWLHLVMPAARHIPRKVTAFRDLVLELLRTRVGAMPQP